MKIKNVNDIYVITLKKENDRKNHFIEQAKKHGISDYEFFYGFDGEMLELTDQLSEMLKYNDYNFRAGIVGCALSHFHLWIKIMNSDKNILIFEDDVIFNDKIKFTEYWNMIIDDIPEDFGIVYLNQSKGIKIYPINNNFFTNTFNNACLTTCSYYINSKMAKIYVDYIIDKGFYRAIDGIMFDIFRKNIFSRKKIQHTIPEKTISAYVLINSIAHNFDDEKFKSFVNIPKIIIPKIYTKTINIYWVNFWADWDITYNFFAQFIKHKFNVNIISDMKKKPNIIFSSIFGPYQWIPIQQVYNDTKKIIFTGENINVENLNFDLAMGFCEKNSKNYFRFPLWIIMIDWFNVYKKQLMGDPDLFHPSLLERGNISYIRKKFCIFVSSDSKCEHRNNLFKSINTYKKVDSAGELYNNITIPNDTHSPSVGRYNRKIDFFTQYKFALVPENCQSNGYCTEKIIHAFASGCIPIYWGDPNVILDFNPNAFINCNNKSFDEIINEIHNIDTNNDLYLKMRNEKVFLNESICELYFKELYDRLEKII